MKDRIIYSTDPNYSSEEEKCYINIIEPANQNLRIWIEKRPGNKIVSIIKNFIGPSDELIKLEKTLKKKCGVGGTIKDKDIIIQTKDRQKLLQILTDLGYFAKLSGG